MKADIGVRPSKIQEVSPAQTTGASKHEMFINVGVVILCVPEVVSVDSSCPYFGSWEVLFVARDMKRSPTGWSFFAAVKDALVLVEWRWQHQFVDGEADFWW